MPQTPEEKIEIEWICAKCKKQYKKLLTDPKEIAFNEFFPNITRLCRNCLTPSSNEVSEKDIL